MRGRTFATFAVPLGYVALSFAYFGWRLLPHPGRMLVGTSGQQDPEIFVWSFAWWPHAILSWTNPFFSHVVYAPTGIDLAWATSVPGLAVMFSPLTLAFGPSVSYNVAAVVLPALSAWTAYLLFRNLTRSSWASLVGGYLYGFSSYMLAHQLAGHLHLTAAFLVPLVALVLLRYRRGELDGRGLTWRLGVMLAFQAYISTEVALTLTLVLGLALLLAFALVPSARRRLVSSLVPIAAAGALAAVLAAPLLYYALTAIVPVSIGYPWFFSADPLNLIVPTSVIGLGGKTFASVSSHFPGNDNERDSYLGLPILVISTLLLWRRPWPGATRFLLPAFGAATFLSLGTALYLDGHRMFWWPWSAPSHLTGLKNIIPSRFALYATLAADTMVAIWISTSRGRVFQRPYVLPLLAAVALVPPIWSNAFVQQPQRLAFFSDGLYKTCIPRGETLLIFPFARWGDSLLWQAESGFWFKMAEGALGPANLPESFAGDPTVNELLFQLDNPSTRPSMQQLLALVRRRHVDRIVSAASVGAIYPNSTQMHAFGVLQQDGDVFIAPACGYTSLAGDTRPPP